VLLTIPAGLRRLAGQTGLSDVVIVLPNGATDESSGTLGAGFAGLVGSLPGVAHSRDGHPLVAAQFVVNTRLRRHDGTTATVLVRGVTPTFWNVIGESVAMRSGRHFRAGTDELISGVAAASSFVSADAGATVLLHAKPWHVSGEFTAEGGFWESELWADLAALQATYNAQGTLTCIWVKLDSPDMFSTFSKALHDDPRTAGLYATRQRDYYTSQTAFLEWFIQVAAEGIAVALGLGAALAIINALSMALDARKRDLAILRALGFRRRALATALLVEVLLNGILCTGISLVLGWLMVDGREIGSSTFSSAIQFKMHIDVNVVVWTLIYLLLLSALSALWPIVRAVRAPLTHALQRE
jgi:putative ABC transport system permease protein